MLGRFVAYKAMNAVWRSAARRGGSGGASSASPTETVRLVLAIVSYAGVFCGGMASCLGGRHRHVEFGLGAGVDCRPCRPDRHHVPA